MKKLVDFFLSIVDWLKYGIEVAKWFVNMVEAIAVHSRSFPVRNRKPNNASNEKINGDDKADQPAS